jgi:DNA uptake protein ComE-like DNA-binding protein
MDRSKIMDGTLRRIPRGWWVLTSLCPVGWLTWLGFGYAGIRARKPAWIAAGAIYLIVTAATLFVTSQDGNITGADDNAGYIVMFSAWGIGIFHAFLTRKAYLRRLDMIEDPALVAARAAEERRRYAEQIARRDPELARTAALGRRGGFDEGGLVDANHAKVEELADLPEITAALAREIVKVRGEVGGFSSIEDLGMTLDLPGDLVERLRRRLMFLPL